MRKFIKIIALMIFIPSVSMAKNFSVDLAAAIGESDNALKARENTISETQNRYSAAVNGDWKAEWATANIQYSAFQESFADDSQEGENYVQGDAAVHLGTEQSLMSLDLRHSRRALLKEAEAKPLADNQEQREILSAMPAMHINVDSKNELMLYSNISRTRYLESEFRDSDRDTYGVDLQHNFSATDNLRLQVSKAETEFLYFRQLDYSLETAALAYQVELRKLSYTLGVGQQKIKPITGDESASDHYQAVVGYASGNSSIRIFYDRSITDTSFGQGFNLIIGFIPGVDTTTEQIRMIDRESTGVDFQTTALCARCTLNLRYTEADDHYLGSDVDANQRGVSLAFDYLFSNRIGLSITHGINHQESPLLNLADDYKQSFSRAALRIGFMRSFSVDIFTERERRSSSVATEDYTENFTGLSLNYRFE